MTTAAGVWSESRVDVAGLAIPVREGGVGIPLLVLPHDTGNPDWLPFHDALAQRHRVVAPTLPGFDGAERPEWMRSVRDMAAVMHFLLDRLDQDRLGVVGLGFGGWLAAEMATMNQSRFSRMALVNAAGLQPADGEILDQFLFGHEDFLRMGFHDPEKYSQHFQGQPSVDQLVQWDLNREMTARIAWKPYMYSQTLPMLLPEVRLPTLVVWGRENRVIPLSCGRQYAEALPDARLTIIDDAGQYLEIEQPQALAAAVSGFLAGG